MERRLSGQAESGGRDDGNVFAPSDFQFLQFVFKRKLERTTFQRSCQQKGEEWRKRAKNSIEYIICYILNVFIFGSLVGILELWIDTSVYILADV